jgi:hypothetical protein
LYAQTQLAREHGRHPVSRSCLAVIADSGDNVFPRHCAARRPERAGVPDEELSREVQTALLIGPCLPDNHPLRLRPRVHRFLRGLARFWRCTSPECGKLLDQAMT